MIKAIVLDIDGVIVGNQKGVNFPHPSKKVTVVLKKVHDRGIPISFLTGKTTFAAWENIKAVGIDNPHIADGGAVIFNPIQNKIIKRKTIPPVDLLKLLDSLPKNTYVNLFTADGYYLEKSLKNNYTEVYGKFIGRPPILVEDLRKIVNDEAISKINISAFDDKEKERIKSALKNLGDQFNSSWSSGPNTGTTQTMVVTAKGVSKRSGVKYLAKYLGVTLDNVLGVGDTIHDWDFMEICGYKAAMGNATEQLKEKINATDSRQVIGGHVNDDGIIDIFKYFKLL